MLDDFSAIKVDAPKAGPAAPKSVADPAKDSSTKGAEAQNQNSGPEDDFLEEEFAKQLQAGMADLLGELEKSVSGDLLAPWPLYHRLSLSPS